MMNYVNVAAMSEQVDQSLLVDGPVHSKSRFVWHRRFFGVLTSVCILALVQHSQAGKNPSLRRTELARGALSNIEDPHSYDSVQYLGLNMFTELGTAADGCYIDSHQSLGECFLGEVNVSTDLERRLDVMRTAIKQSYDSPNWNRSGNVLKIFMAPEFFWRGPQGAYILDGQFAFHARKVFGELQAYVSNADFKDWIFVMGTAIAVQMDQSAPWSSSHLNYYNFAPVYIGGEKRLLLQFKHFISLIDFAGADPQVNVPPPVPNPTSPEHRSPCVKAANRTCAATYGEFSAKQANEMLGLDADEVLHGGIFTVNGLTLGLEICLDHKQGVLAKEVSSRFGENGTVAVHLISSAGMNIASGPVVTPKHGPVFLNDGNARTAMATNIYGRGGEVDKTLDGMDHYDVGVVYGSDSTTAFNQWAGSIIHDFSGNKFGESRNAGYGTMPGGMGGHDAGFQFSQIDALGADWNHKLSGIFNIAPYDEALRLFSAVEIYRNTRMQDGHMVFSNDSDPTEHNPYVPTIDFYGPLPLGSSK